MSLPREEVLLLETEDQLEQALGSRQVIEYASQDAATPTALPSATPIPLSPLFLQESAGDMLLAAVPRPESSPPHLSCSYDLGAIIPSFTYFPAQYARLLITTKLHSVVIVWKNCLSGILAVYREIGEGGYNM